MKSDLLEALGTAVRTMVANPIPGAGLTLAHRKRLTVAIKAGLQEHVMPPVALGQQHASLVHKMSAFTHSVFLESTSIKDASDRESSCSLDAIMAGLAHTFG